MNKRNRKGWIKIVEAFVAILLVAGVLLIVVNRNSNNSTADLSDRIYNAEISIIREIQVNVSLRNEIVSLIPPVEWDSSSFPANIKNLIISRTPNYLDCVAKICDTSDACFLTAYTDKDTYAQSGIISGTQTEINALQLKLFCWQK